MEAVLYAAKSTKDPKGSIKTQLAEGRAWAEAEDCPVVAEYADEAASAWRGNRGPELIQAMDHAERIGGVLIVQHSDRLARGDGKQARHLVEVALWAIKTGVTVLSLQDPATFENIVLAAVMGERNTEDSKRKSEAVKAGIKRRARERGLPTGGTRAFGYEWAKDGSGLLVIKSEAAVVRHRIYEATLAGVPQLQIMRDLEADGVPTVGGRRWHQGAISRMLQNPLYKGMFLYKGELVEGSHEAIVSAKLWGQVAELRAAREKAGKGRGRPPKGRHLFRKGMLLCVCGESLVPRTSRTGKSRKAGVYEGYICYGKHRDPRSCSMLALPRAKVDTAIYRYFERVGLDIEATRAQLEESRATRQAEVSALLEQAETAMQKVEERLARVRSDYTEGKLPAEDWVDFKRDLGSDLEAASNEVERLSAQRDDVEEWADQQDIEQDILEKLADLRAAIAGEVNDAKGIEEVRAALLRIFEGFAVREIQPGMRVHADLAWQKDGLVIEPIIREKAIEGYTNLRPVFRRERVYDAQTITRGSRPGDSRY